MTINNSRRSGWRKVKAEWCQACEMDPATEVHHIRARVDGGTDEETNLIDLCWLCHQFAPSDPEDFEDYKRWGGFRGSIIHNSVLYTLTHLSERKCFGGPDGFYKKVYGSKFAGVLRTVKIVKNRHKKEIRALRKKQQ